MKIICEILSKYERCRNGYSSPAVELRSWVEEAYWLGVGFNQRAKDRERAERSLEGVGMRSHQSTILLFVVQYILG